MNYTQNYHLPQWVQEDRVLMEDFNSAMSNIESGLAGIRRDLDGNAADGVQAQSKTWDALLRAGRSLLAQRMEQFSRDQLYAREGLFFNPLSSAEMAEEMSGTQWSETMGVYAGRGAYMPDDVLLSSCTSCQTGSTGIAYNLPYAASYYEFVAPVTGTIREFNYNICVYANSTLKDIALGLTFKAEKWTKGAYSEICRKTFRVDRKGTTTIRVEMPVAVNIPIVKGTKYRLYVTPNNQASTVGYHGFLTSAQEDAPEAVAYTKFKVVGPAKPRASHTRSFPTGGPASHALAVVRYRKEEDASAIGITLDGTAMTRVREREFLDKNGETCREAWYAGEGGYQGDAQVKLSLDSTESDDLRLLEYAILLL